MAVSGCVAVICLGTAVASRGEIAISRVGLALQLAANVGEALRVSLRNATAGHGSSWQQGGTFVLEERRLFVEVHDDDFGVAIAGEVSGRHAAGGACGGEGGAGFRGDILEAAVGEVGVQSGRLSGGLADGGSFDFG